MDELQEPIRIGAPPTKPRKRRTGLIALMGGLVAAMVLVLGGVAWVVLTKTPAGDAVAAITEPPLVSAQKKCAPSSPHVEVGDGGKTLTIQTEGKEHTGLSYAELRCFWTELKVTDAVRSEMESTRALDGRQTGDWGQFHASWTYHPDNGFNMVVTAT